MFELTSLGFEEQEIHRAVLDEEGRLFISTEWYGEVGYFMIGTMTRLDLSLNGVGVRSDQLPLLRSNPSFAVHHAEDFTILGKHRPAGEITVFPSSDEGTVFGTIGSLFFDGATVAFDPAGPHVALAERPWSPPEDTRLFSLPLLGPSGLPLTDAIRFEVDPSMAFATLLSTGTVRSYVSQAVADALPSRSVGHGRSTRIRFPGGSTQELVFDVVETMPEYVVDVGTEPLGMVLGIDVLRSFLLVCSFGSKQAYLEAYGPTT